MKLEQNDILKAKGYIGTDISTVSTSETGYRTKC